MHGKHTWGVDWQFAGTVVCDNADTRLGCFEGRTESNGRGGGWGNKRMTSTPDRLAGCGFVLGRGLWGTPAMTIQSSAVELAPR